MDSDKEEEEKHFGLNTLDQVFALATESEKKIIARRLHMKANKGGKYYFKNKNKTEKTKNSEFKQRSELGKLATENAHTYVIKN